MPTRETISRSEADTERLAAALAQELRPGDVVLLAGNLGAGKTAFVRGLATGLGVDGDKVSSPTFALIHEHRGGRLPLFHVDLYRLTRADTEDLGLEELSVQEGVLAIEWPDRLARTFRGAIDVQLEADAAGRDTDRRVVIRLPDSRS